MASATERNAPVGESVTAANIERWQVRLHDTLAGGRRLWVRGMITLPKPGRASDSKRWWLPWSKDEKGPALPPFHLETRVSTTSLATDVHVKPDGQFEATFTTTLVPSRRGWRVARNRVSDGAHEWEGCNVVLTPPDEARAGVVVVLPVHGTYAVGSGPRLADSSASPPLDEFVSRLQHIRGGPCPVYYLACVPPDGWDRHSELALAVTALGWPAGYIVLLPTAVDDAPKAVASAVERLRWLFAGTMELWLLNLEPDSKESITKAIEAREEHAPVRLLSDLPGDPGKAQADGAAIMTVGRRSGLRPTRAAGVPRYPVVFCHGMLAFSMLKMYHPEEPNYFTPLGQFLSERGFRCLFPEVPATSGVVERSELLREQIVRWTDEPVNIIAHSMGGLDARYLITHLGMADRVRSLTTISTPHRGSYLADWFTANYRHRLPLLVALEAFGLNVDGFRDCKPAICRAFNENTPDVDRVRYFSFGGEVTPSHLTPFLRRAWNILYAVEGPNDGLVSLMSSRWGEYLGTIHADHFAQTPDGVFLRDGENFDSLGFFTRLVEDIARRGF